MGSEFIKNCQELSENLKRCRKCAGLTQKQVAEQLGMEYKHYRYIESGHLMPSIFKLIKAAEIFGVGVLEIICKKQPKGKS